MFRRGNIVVAIGSGNRYVVADPETHKKLHIPKGFIERAPLDSDSIPFKPYEGPVFSTEDGKRFIPTGEFRKAKKGDWVAQCDDMSPLMVNFETSISGTYNSKYDMKGYRIILAPVPELEPEKPKKPKKRPLTTDDLMQVLRGKKVVVECYGCGCGKAGGSKGEVIAGKFWNGTIAFFHQNTFFIDGSHIIDDPMTGPCHMDYYIAIFKGGSIHFAEGVENKIFVVDEG